MEERQEYLDHKAFWIVMVALLLLTRIPVTASYLSIDNVNLAFSLDKFDPRIHQPQPPGYPFFVFFARVVNFVFRNPERTFLVISLLVSGACLPPTYALGRRMFSAWAGAAAAFLLLVNPAFWFSGLDGPLRPNLALFSLLTAYCSWRCWNGEKQYALWGAAALGIGSGFRPDLIAFVFPVWIISTWVGTKSWRTIFTGLAVLAAIVCIWIGALIIAMGGVETFRKIMFEYAVDQSRPESIVLGSSLFAWLRQINRLVIWNGLAIIGWIWAIPFYLRYRDRVPIGSPHTAFFLIWLMPGLTLQALVHIGAPGHTLYSVPALCVIGGYILSLVPGRQTVLAAVLILNVMFFLDFVPMPVDPKPDSLPSVKNAMLYGTFETSVGYIRWFDEITRLSLKELDAFTPSDRPSVIITTDTYVKQWFLNWRIGRYYRPKREFWVLYKDGQMRGAQLIRRDEVLRKMESNTIKLPVPSGTRILWLIEPYSDIDLKVGTTYKLLGNGRYVFFNDLKDNSPPVAFDGFEIVPVTAGSSPQQN